MQTTSILAIERVEVHCPIKSTRSQRGRVDKVFDDLSKDKSGRVYLLYFDTAVLKVITSNDKIQTEVERRIDQALYPDKHIDNWEDEDDDDDTD